MVTADSFWLMYHELKCMYFINNQDSLPPINFSRYIFFPIEVFRKYDFPCYKDEFGIVPVAQLQSKILIIADLLIDYFVMSS